MVHYFFCRHGCQQCDQRPISLALSFPSVVVLLERELSPSHCGRCLCCCCFFQLSILSRRLPRKHEPMALVYPHSRSPRRTLSELSPSPVPEIVMAANYGPPSVWIQTHSFLFPCAKGIGTRSPHQIVAFTECYFRWTASFAWPLAAFARRFPFLVMA